MNYFDYLAIILSVIATFILGGVWYSPMLFGKIWQEVAGVNMEQIAKARVAKTFILAFIYALIAAIAFHYLVENSPSLIHNLKMGLLCGVLLVGTAIGVNYAFANRGNKLLLIDAGFHIVKFILYAVIFWFIK